MRASLRCSVARLSLFTFVVATSPRALAGFPPPEGIGPTCGMALAGFAPDSERMPRFSGPVAQEAWDLLTVDVPKQFKALKEGEAHASKPPSGPELYAEALAMVRKQAGSRDPSVLQAFDAYAKQIEAGRKEFEENVAILNDPAAHLKKDKLTAGETRELAEKAYRFLIQNGTGTPNMAHIADHLATLKAIEPTLRQAGIDPAEVQLAMLLHDLGKEYRFLPASYRAFVESASPGDFLGREIMPHEFGSMVVIDRLGREMGLPAEKIARLKALIARHNAGYDPKLPGSHFWVAPFAWPAFAARVGERVRGLSGTYEPVLPTDQGGSPVTPVLTAIDRATSFTLASQEKFATRLVNSKMWSNTALATQMIENARNVGAEVKSVLTALKPPAVRADHATELEGAIDKAFKKDVQYLETLGAELPKMARAEGAYADGAKLVENLPKEAVVYRNRAGVWHRVDGNGDYYRANADKSGWEPVLKEKAQGTDAPTRLFRNAIFEDFGYTSRSIVSYAPGGVTGASAAE